MRCFNLSESGEYSVIEFNTPSLLDRYLLEELGTSLAHLVDVEDRRKLIMDFHQVLYMSSHAISLLLMLHRKLAALPKSRLVLVALSPRLVELLKITRLDALFEVKSTSQQALA